MTGWYDRWCEAVTLSTFRSGSTKTQHALSIALTVLSLIAVVVLGRAHGHSPGLVLLIAPVVASAAMGGIGTGLVATAVAAFGAALFLVPPLGSFRGGDAVDHIRLAALVGTGVLTSVLSDLLRRAARRAHDAERFDSVVLATLGDGVLATDEWQRVRFLNVQAARLTGWRPEDAIGQPLAAVVRFASGDAGGPPSVGRGNAGSVTGTLRGRDGRETHVAVEVQALGSAHGRAGGVVVVIHDRSDACAAQEANRERQALETRLRDVAATAPGALYSFQQHVDGSFSFPFASDAIEPLLAISPEELMASAEAGFARVEPEDLTRIFETALESARTLSPWHLEFRVHHPDKGSVFVEGRSIPHREPDGSTIWHGVFLDVSERMRASQALAGSEARFRSYVERAPDAVVVLAPGGQFQDANHAAERMTGRTVDELRSMRITDLVLAEDHPRLLADQRRLRIEGLVEGEYRITPRDGEPIWASIRASLLEDGTSLAYAHDVTARRRAETAIHESEARLKGIIESAMDGIVTVDEHQRIVMVNPAAERMFGSRLSELRGQHLNVLVPDDARADHDGHIARFFDGPRDHRTSGNLTVRGRRADGELFPLEASVSRVTVAGRTLVTVFLRDVSGRIRAQQALAESDQRFRQLADNIREVFWLADVETPAVLYVSPAYESIWGRRAEELLVSFGAWIDALYPEDRDRVLDAVPKMVAGDYDEEYRIVRPDGAIRWIRDRAFPVRESDGRVTRLAGIAEDVTERRQLEAQLRQTQKMESIGLLAGGVAHDFNNLLTVIAGNVELLIPDLPSEGDQRILATEIQAAGERAAALTRQLLAFSRREVLEPKVLRLERVVADTEKMLRRLLGEDIVLTTSLSPSTARVNLDPGHVTQVIVNLAVNARDAMPRGGRLTIATDSVVRDAAYAASHPLVRPGPYVMLSLSDTGCGMTPEVRGRVFEPFFTTKGPGRGTGLGLAVVHGIVEQSGGHLELDSTPGVGTTLRLYFPAVVETIHARTERNATGGDRGSETVLLVEDDESVRRLGARALESYGYTVHVATDGKEALARVYSGTIRPDLVVTDVVMPRMNGRELSDALRQRHPTLKVLFTSGYTDDAVIRNGIDRAEVAFLQKPYTPLTLVRNVRDLLDRS